MEALICTGLFSVRLVQIKFVCINSLVWPNPPSPPGGKELQKKSSLVQCTSFNSWYTLYKDLNNRGFKTCFAVIYTLFNHVLQCNYLKVLAVPCKPAPIPVEPAVYHSQWCKS